MKCFELSEELRPGVGISRARNMYLALGGGETTVRIPVSRQFSQVLNAVKGENVIPLLYAECVHTEEGLLIVPETNSRSRQALLVLQTAPPNVGSMKLCAQTFKESSVGGWVQKTYNPREEIVGIETLATGHFPEDERVEELFLMDPGSGFVIQREGQLEGAPYEFNVSWNGYKMFVSTKR